ncbi:hypothetical protein AOLI_G00045810 [Acnodon oligacanthus]
MRQNQIHFEPLSGLNAAGRRSIRWISSFTTSCEFFALIHFKALLRIHLQRFTKRSVNNIGCISYGSAFLRHYNGRESAVE